MPWSAITKRFTSAINPVTAYMVTRCPEPPLRISYLDAAPDTADAKSN